MQKAEDSGQFARLATGQAVGKKRRLRAESRIQFAVCPSGHRTGSRQNITVKAGRQRALARCKQIVINHDKTESRKLRAESRIQFARLATGQAVGQK
jgi:hypothetical protein